MKGWMWTALVALIVAGLSYSAFVVLSPGDLSPGLLYGNGHIEGTEVEVSAEVTGRVVESNLVEGTSVEKGDMLVRLVDAELQTRLAQEQAEAAALEQTQTRLELELPTWQHHLKTAREDLARFRELRYPAKAQLGRGLKGG